MGNTLSPSRKKKRSTTFDDPDRIENFEAWLDRVMTDPDLRDEVLAALRNRAALGNNEPAQSAADELLTLMGGQPAVRLSLPPDQSATATASASVAASAARGSGVAAATAAQDTETGNPSGQRETDRIGQDSENSARLRAPAARKPRQNGPWTRRFIEKLKECPNITIAARLVDVDPSTPRKRMETDAAFRVDVEKALEQGMDIVEASALKSAVFGDRRPIMWQGIKVGEELSFSDRMRELLLRGRRPDVFRDRQDIRVDGEIRMKLQTPDQRRETTLRLLGDIPRYPVPAIKRVEARVITDSGATASVSEPRH